MSHENLDRCFKTFHDYNAQSNTDGLKTINPTFMQKAKDEFTNGNVMIKYHIKDKKYVFNELVKFLDHCKVGEWSHAKESYHQASKEYETFVKALDVIKVNANKLQETDHNRVTTISDGANKSTDSNRSRVPRVTMESPIEGQSTSRTPRVKYQTTTKHTTGKMLTTAQNEKTLSNQGQAVQHTSGNTNEYSSRSDKESRMEHHKGNNQFRMTDARNNKATLQEVTSVSPMDADLPSPDYHTNSESNKASIVKPAKTPLPRAAPVSLSKRDTYSLDQDIDKTSDQATRGKTDYDTNDADIYRRSQRASILLRENNPNITDLSDPNRPTRLAERFSELYSNEHTDTFEELTKCCQRESFGDTQEREIVNSLLLVVKKAYEHCTKRNEEIDKKLASEKQTRTTKTEDEAIYLKGQLLQKKKMIAQDKADDVIKVFLKEKIPNLSPSYATERAKSKYKIYAEKTVEIVWWMCVQNPPIHLEYAKSGPFDSSLYRSYTKSGKSIDFCVWPLVRLQRNGPILAKGIAQGTNA